VAIDATHDAETLMDQGPVGWREVCRMQARAVAWDSWLSEVRTLSIEDRVPRGAVDIPIDLSRSALDAAAVIDRAARAVGYSATPPPAGGAVVSLPLVGSLWGEVGPTYVPAPLNSGARYTTRDGVAMLTDSLVNPLGLIDGQGLAPEGGLPATFAVAFTATIGSPAGSGWRPTVTLSPLTGAVFGRYELGLNNTTPQLRVIGYGSTVTVTLPTYTATSRVRYVVTFEATHATQWQGTWRVYADGLLAGSGSTSVSTFRDTGVHGVSVQATADGAVGGVQLGPSLTATDYGLLEAETALIGSARSPLEAIIEPTSGDAWAIIQDVARATLGAAWIDERGRLVYRGREALRTAVPVTTVDALDRLEDIPGSISVDEVADRVEVTYRPSIVTTVTDTSLTVYDSDETVRVNANSTVNLDRDLEVASAGSGGTWLRVEDVGTYPVTRMSRYAAWTAPPGESGAAPAAGALLITARMLTPTRMRITILNATASPLWVYRLIGRTDRTVAAGAPITLTSGRSERDALNPLSVDLGGWVQDGDVAHAILDWLTGETTAPTPVLAGIRIAPDLDLRQGDTILLRIESMTGDPAHRLVIKALITGDELSAAPGSLEQHLTLTLLAPTEADLADYYDRRGLVTEADVAALWASLVLPTEADIAAWMARGGIYA